MASTQKKQIQDEDGIVYEETDYETYLKAKDKHRIVKSLEHQWFVQMEKQVKCHKCGCECDDTFPIGIEGSNKQHNLCKKCDNEMLWESE